MRVVVVEDQLLFCEFLVALLRDRAGCEVLGTAADGERALELIRETRPDLVVLDILIPKLSGIHVARTVQQELPGTSILALSSEMDVKTVYQVHRLQLSGFIDKNEASLEVLLGAIACMRARQRFFSDSVKATVARLRTDPQAFPKILTRREQEVLTHIGAGRSDPEIGQLLGLTETSVQSHRRNLLRKVGVHSTPELIRFAVDAGFWKAAFGRMGLDDSYHLHE